MTQVRAHTRKGRVVRSHYRRGRPGKIKAKKETATYVLRDSKTGRVFGRRRVGRK